MFDLSPVQVLIVLAIALVVFGPRRLPEMARSVGRSMHEFKEGITSDRPVATQADTPVVRAPLAADSPADAVDDDLDGMLRPGDDQPDAPGRDATLP